MLRSRHGLPVNSYFCFLRTYSRQFSNHRCHFSVLSSGSRKLRLSAASVIFCAHSKDKLLDIANRRSSNAQIFGFGYVTYKCQKSVDNALNSQPHSIDNKDVFVKHSGLRQREFTLFIGNLSQQTTDESLNKHFSEYGQLTQCNVKTDPITGKSCGFGYVSFESQKEPHVIDGVDVRQIDKQTKELDLMVESLPQNISEESLKKSLWDFFSCYGQVRDCRFIKNSAGRTTAFVSMSSRDEVDNALNSPAHCIDNKDVFVKHVALRQRILTDIANRRSSNSQIFDSRNFSTHYDPDCRVYVRGLLKSTTVDSLRDHFKQFAIVQNCHLFPHRAKGTFQQIGYVDFVTPQQAESVTKRAHVIDGKEVSVAMHDRRNVGVKYTIFVGGLSKQTSGETFHKHFSQFGDVFECSIAKNNAGSSRGFGFVDYTSQKSADSALKSRPHSIDNKVVEVRLSDDRSRDLTMFVGNLSPKTTDESLKRYFSRYGPLAQCNVKIDSKTRKSRGFGHVGFMHKGHLLYARNSQPHVIDGVQVTFNSSTQNLVVDSLPKNITKDSLWDFFSHYGQVQDCRMVTNSLGAVTAFVTFSNEEEIAEALADRPHCINGKMVCTYQKGEQFSIYVGGLPTNATENSLYTTFFKFGHLVHWEVKRDADTRLSRNYGFVTFSTPEEVDRVIDSQPVLINGTQISPTNLDDVRFKSRPMISHFRHLRTYFHQIFKSQRQICGFSSIVSIQSNVNHEVTRKTLSVVRYRDHSKEKLLIAANHRHWTSQIYRFQSFSSSRSGPGKFDESRTLMVAGLSKDTTVAYLRDFFSQKWEVTNCRIARDKKTGASLQYGFVELLTAEQTLEYDHKIDGKNVSVRMSGNKELDEKYQIFVGGLLKETSQETLHCHFSKFGDIFACDIVRNNYNLSRGFGYVTYKCQKSVDNALNSQPHSVDKQVVTVKHSGLRQRNLTLFIGKLSPETTDESLREHFSKYGQLTDCEVKIDRQTGLSRGFGYVGYASQEELNRALNEQLHVVDGVEVEINNRSSKLDLMVESLPQNMSEESLKKSLWDFFSRYGQVRDCKFIKNSAGTTTAFVSMSSRDEISRALAGRPHRIDTINKLVNTHQKGEEFALFVSGLPKNGNNEDLYETFSKVGNPVHWEVKCDPKTNRSFGYGYVSFSSAEEVDRVMDRRPYSIHGQEVTVQRRLARKKQ
ncbi:RNA recognition motif domain-containing protein [Ditylenchus destructor]|nr:RNA recognition motif domain-containing protein [Ditylenchus destructor]